MNLIKIYFKIGSDICIILLASIFISVEKCDIVLPF